MPWAFYVLPVIVIGTLIALVVYSLVRDAGHERGDGATADVALRKMQAEHDVRKDGDESPRDGSNEASHVSGDPADEPQD